MPAQDREAKFSAIRVQYSTEYVLRIERRAFAAGKDKDLSV
jgi:hypothetical protein